MRKRVMLVGVVVLAVGMLAAGCGGSSSSDATSTEDVTTEDTTEGTGSGTADGRLTTEQWAAYDTARKSFVASYTKANARFDVCAQAATQQDSDKFSTCAGDAFANLAKAGDDIDASLKAAEDTVGGSCKDAWANLANLVVPFQSAADEMQNTIDTANFAGYAGAQQAFDSTAMAAQQAGPAFTKECAPA